MKDKFDFIEKRFGRMMDAWEIMGQNWERREKERRGGEKESSSFHSLLLLYHVFYSLSPNVTLSLPVESL
jgi:hypothetical protein